MLSFNLQNTFINNLNMKTISVIEIKVSALLNMITAQINKEYFGFKVKHAYKVEQNNVTTFDVDIRKGKQFIILSFDKSGNLLDALKPKTKKIIKLAPIAITEKNTDQF